MSQLQAVIFDLDGTLLDNNDYHYKAWQQYLTEAGKEISDEDFKKNISGRTNKDAVSHIYKKEMDEKEAEKYYLKKEEIYRQLYKQDIAPIRGLTELLEELSLKNIIMAIATSGIQVNIDFMFEHVDIKKYFSVVVNSSDIKRGKPDPEIFLKTAERLQVAVENCLVFEDSIAGVSAGKAAGMKVVALTTSHSHAELENADMVIDDYRQVNYATLLSII